MSMVKIYKKVDLTGTSCAGPIGELMGLMDEINQGEAVEALLKDEETKNMVISWAKTVGLKIFEERKEGNNFVVVVGK
jgi:TusA-related sulfurtransferase